MWKPRHLHHQLILVVSALMLLAIGLLGAYTVYQQSVMVMHSAKTQAATLARNVAISSSNPLLTDSLDVLEELARRSADFEDVLEIRIASATGQVLAHVQRQADGKSKLVFDPPGGKLALPVAAAASAGEVNEHEVADEIVAWHPIVAGDVVGWVRVDFSTRTLNDVRQRIWASTALVAVLSVALCSVILIRFLFGPMRALQRATQFAVGLNDIRGQQMSVDTGAIETEALGGALNEASSHLHAQRLSIEEGMRQLRINEVRLQEQNECLNAIFSLSPDGLVTFNREGRVHFANQAFLSLTGLLYDQVHGRTEAELVGALSGVSSEHIGPGLPARLNIKRADGVGVLTLSEQLSQALSVSKVLYVCDITRQQQLDQMKSDFLSMAAHELRTPMTSIYGFTELMLKRDMPIERMKDLLLRVHVQSQAIMAIINELLDLARLEAKQGADFALQELDLYDAVSEALSGFLPPDERQPPLLQQADGPLPVYADESKLRQAIVNVVSNAYKYSPAGGDVRVSFINQTLPEGRRAGVVITDHGLGLSPENLARMGERFFRADKSGHIPGTGLGVSIVMELMSLMGGGVDISSELGRGTSVTLWLPCQVDPPLKLAGQTPTSMESPHLKLEHNHEPPSHVTRAAV